jgi:hypothetical protein
MKSLRLVASLVLGCVAAVAIARVAFPLLGTLWPAYAEAAPAKSFTLAMLFARLAIAAGLTVAAAAVATFVARDGGRAAWILGGLFVLLSLPSHLHYVWNDYPAWYHAVYLLSLVPLAGYSGRIVSDWFGTRAVAR